jgi:hypothetical protein
VLQRLNSAVKLIQRTTPEAPERRYELHRTGWSPTCSQWNAENRTSCLRENAAALPPRENLPRKEKYQDHPVRRLPGPAGDGLSQQMDVQFCGEQEPKAERHCCVTTDSDQTNIARSPERAQKILCFSVDKDWVENRVRQAGPPIGSTR